MHLYFDFAYNSSALVGSAFGAIWEDPEGGFIEFVAFSTSTRSDQSKLPKLASKMEKIFSNPGLQHLAEKVFWNLDAEDLKICAQINQS